MARVNVDQEFWSDPRFDYLATILGQESVPLHVQNLWLSRYRCLLLWNHCYNKRTPKLTPKQVAYACQWSGDPEQLIDAFVEADVVFRDGQDVVVKGIDKRIAYLVGQAERGKLGGRPRKIGKQKPAAASAMEMQKPNAFESESSAKTIGQANASKYESLPLALSLALPPALSLAPDNKNNTPPPPSGGCSVVAEKNSGSDSNSKLEAEEDPTPGKEPRRKPVTQPPGVSDQTWSDFLASRKIAKAPVTQTALDGIIREASKAGWTLEAALTECVLRGWRSFKAEWVSSKRPSSEPPPRDKPIVWSNGGRF